MKILSYDVIKNVVYCHLAYLTYMQSTSWETLGWKKHKLESRLPGEISRTSDMQMAESEELKILLIKVKEESGKVGLKLSIQLSSQSNSHLYMITGKTIALTRWTFVGKVMSLLLNVITFLPRSKHLLISCLQSPSAVILEPSKIKPDTVSTVSHLFAWSDRTRCHDLSFPNVEL